jgi:predicted nuclease of predicted toxin-antitoxin system
VAEQDQSVVVTKDDYFVQAFLIQGQPKKLLLISTGNISNNALETLVRKHITEIAVALETASFIELGRTSLIVHE